MTDPARWMDLPAEAPHGAVELLASVQRPPALDPVMRAEVGREVARLAASPARLVAPSRWAWMAAAAVLLFSLGVATTLVLTGAGEAVRPAPATGPATSMHPVEPAEPGLSEEEQVAAPAEAEPPSEQVADGPERRVATPPDHRPPKRTRRLPSSRSQPPVAQQRGEHAEGALTVNTMPWSRVFIDGRDLGNTPIVRRRVQAGRHELTFAPRGDADATVRRTVEIRAGETTRLVLRL